MTHATFPDAARASVIDHAFEHEVIAAAERGAEFALDADERAELSGMPHRDIAHRMQTLFSVYVSPNSRYFGAPAILNAAAQHATALAALQSPMGLFVGGDNVQSPPDSAFTINDVCDVYAFTSNRTEAALETIRERLAAIVHAATEPLLRGGVHTPNHRWELSAALIRIHRSFPADRIVARVNEWLAEGVDIDHDGLYSERSPNYAAHVTNPSLLVISRVLGRDDLRAIVERNLEATLALLRPDNSVETLQSRRQDQKSSFRLDHYLAQFRLLAITTGRGDFSWAAQRAQESGVNDQRLLAVALIEPKVLDELPPASIPAPKRETFLASVGLASRRDGAVESVVYGGSDYALHRRIRSGLANNPTFFRLFAGEAVLDAVRLSRSFFDVGPFRPDSMMRLADGHYRLEEQVTAAYYQPLPAVRRRPSGSYDLLDDGRFSAAMSFPERLHDELTMDTRINIDQVETGADIALEVQAPQVAWALELTFRPGGEFDGVEPIGEGRWLLTAAEGSYRVGRDRIVFGPGGASVSHGALLYHPGQEYEYLGGTDATTGERLYVTGTAPSKLMLRIRAEIMTDERVEIHGAEDERVAEQ
jgi:hypothetical protein